MEFTEKELEALITYAEQIKVLVPRMTYSEELISNLFKNMKDKTKVSDKDLYNISNNFIALDLIGLEYDKKLRRKIDKYVDK